MKHLLSNPPKLIPPSTPPYQPINVFIPHSCPKVLRQKTHPDFHPSSPTYLQPPSSQASQVCSFMGVICSSHGGKHVWLKNAGFINAVNMPQKGVFLPFACLSQNWQFGKHQTDFFGHWVIGMITCKFDVLKISASRISIYLKLSHSSGIRVSTSS